MIKFSENCKICEEPTVVLQRVSNRPKSGLAWQLPRHFISAKPVQKLWVGFKFSDTDWEQHYEKKYEIKYDNDDEDQIYFVDDDGQIIYRTSHQAELITEVREKFFHKEDIIRVLDYGCAKAQTAQKLSCMCNCDVFGFDVTKNIRVFGSVRHLMLTSLLDI